MRILANTFGVVRAENGMIVYGEHGVYKGQVYCWTGKRTVEVSGFDLDQIGVI